MCFFSFMNKKLFLLSFFYSNPLLVQVVLERIGWSEEKSFRDLEGVEERFTILVTNIKMRTDSNPRRLK